MAKKLVALIYPGFVQWNTLRYWIHLVKIAVKKNFCSAVRYYTEIIIIAD